MVAAIMTENTRPTTVSSTSVVPTSGVSASGVRRLTGVAVALMMALSAGSADARASKSTSSGSRGDRTYSAPATTSTAPTTAKPMERTTAPAAQPGVQAPAAAAQSGGFFRGGGFMSGLMGGLIGAGIGAMLFGGGFFSGLGSFAGILGFILQIVLVVFLVRLAMRFFRNRSAQSSGPIPAYAGGPLNRDATEAGFNPQQGGGPLGGGLGGRAAPRQPDEIGVQPADYEAFERLLVGVQTAYGREDVDGLSRLATPEMLSYFSGDLADNKAKGVVNKVSDVTLLQGDLSEAWREGNVEYATVAMRFSLIDVTLDRASGRVVEGDASRPTEATELWTFIRPLGGAWHLSAIQQTR
jgi:predicted lipid-binding transport protein (Tim44 family)